MTYTLFTLFPILLFALVTLWKLKLNYDEDIFQLEKKLSKATIGLNKSSSLSLILSKKAKEEEKENMQLKEENLVMTNKTETLKERMKTVEARALNLTSKLLLKEMDIGLLKKEKIRLESQVQMQKEKEEKQEKVSTMKLLDKKETKISLANLTKTERKEPTLMSTNNSVGERSSSEQSDVKEQIVDKLLDIKKKQHELETDKEQVIEKAEKVERDTDKEEIVDKLVDIKKKQQELEEAKKDFFSDTVGETASSEGKVISENTIAESENVKTNDSINTERKNETLTLNVNQEDIQSLIELPDPSNFTKEPTPPLPSTMSTLTSNLPSPAPISPLKVLDPLSNGSIVVNTLNGTSVAGYNGTDQEKKIHIILDVSNKENT